MSGTSTTTVHNERLKLAATLFNNIAAAFVVTGIIVPAAAYAYQVSPPHGRFWILYAILWVGMAAVNHHIARQILKGLTP